MSYRGKRAIVERIESIAVWREEREFQDMMGLGPEAAARSRRSALGLRELAAYFDALPDDDERISSLMRLAFSGDYFDPGASLLNDLGRFRFHDPDQPLEQFVEFMVKLAQQDREDMGQWGGPQLPGDNPWSGKTIVRAQDPDEVEDDW